MSTEIILIVKLYVYPGKETEFQQFETEVAQIMPEYGGRIERVIKPIDSPAQPDAPYEVHLVRFPSLAQLEAYRLDSRWQSLAELRQAAIRRTEILVGQEQL
jgi:uncharacterized protein (DUF1330 family)